MGAIIDANCTCCDNKRIGEIKVPHPGSKSNKSLMTQDKMKAHTAKAFLVTCMDFRLFNDTTRIMKEKGYDVNYDQFVLAGVSLGFLQTTYPGWGKALFDHIDISLKLHKIVKVILLDHLDCGAYKTFCKGLKPEREYEEHRNNLKIAKEKILNHFPTIKVKTWILHLDGKLDTSIDNK